MLRFESDSSLCSIASTERLKSLDVFVTNDTVPENPRNVQISVPSGVRPLLGRRVRHPIYNDFFHSSVGSTRAPLYAHECFIWRWSPVRSTSSFSFSLFTIWISADFFPPRRMPPPPSRRSPMIFFWFFSFVSLLVLIIHVESLRSAIALAVSHGSNMITNCIRNSSSSNNNNGISISCGKQ